VSVVVVGDANVDLELRLPGDTAPRVHANPDPRLFGGGSAANTAAALGRLGVPCRFVGSVGDDVYGRFAVSSLAEAGVDTDHVQVSAESPTVTVIAVTRQSGDRIIYVWPPSGGAHGELTPQVAIDAIVGASWLHVSGICLRVAPARDAVLAAMERARAASVPVSFDLNLRLENWGWDSEFRTAVEHAMARCDVMFGGAFDEISALAGVDDPVAAAEQLSGAGRLVIARRGVEGAIACSGGRVLAAPGFAVAVTDTIGAGDAFNAGFIAARVGGGDVASGLAWGNAVAALTITRPGARSTPTAAEAAHLVTGGGNDGRPLAGEGC